MRNYEYLNVDFNSCFSCWRDSVQSLYYAANQGQMMARRLNRLASQLQEAVSNTNDIRRLLKADEALECALSQVLRNELSMMQSLCGQRKICGF